MILAENVGKVFYAPHEIHALCGVSTTVKPGEVVVIIGPSGSGKSTFLRCLNRLEYADTGRILIEGVDILDPATKIDQGPPGGGHGVPVV